MAFATSDDVAARLQRTLTSAEQAAATAAIADVTGQIVEAVDRDAAWAAALVDVPATFKAICVEKALAAITNPLGVAAQALGAASYTFRRNSDGGVLLTDSDERRVRRAWFGTATGTARTRSAIDDVLDHRDDGEIDDIPL